MDEENRFVDIKKSYRQKDDYYKHKAEYLMDIETDKNLITMSYYLEEVSGVPATIYRSFMADFVEKLESKRRFGFIRLIMETGNPDPFSILIRCFNAYINGLHNGKKLFELGHHDRDPRYFLDCELTGYREEYFELLGTDKMDENNLIGLWLGPNALRVDALEVQRNPGVPKIWKRPIARFAITFCESARLVLINEDLVVAFESLKDFEIRGNYAYITRLTRFWGDICKAAENRIENDTVESDPPVQPEGDKRTISGCRNLKTNSAYARQALIFRTTRFEGASNKRRKRDVFGSVVEGMESIKKKNALESDKGKKKKSGKKGISSNDDSSDERVKKRRRSAVTDKRKKRSDSDSSSSSSDGRGRKKRSTKSNGKHRKNKQKEAKKLKRHAKKSTRKSRRSSESSSDSESGSSSSKDGNANRHVEKARAKPLSSSAKKDLARKEPEAKLEKDHDLKKVVATSSDGEQDPTLKNDELVKNGLVKETKPVKPSSNQHQHSDDPSRSRVARSPGRRDSRSSSRSPSRKGSQPSAAEKRKTLSRSRSPNDTPKRVRKGRGFTKEYSFTRKYLTPSPERPSGRSRQVGYAQGRYNDRIPNYRRYSERSPRRRNRSPPRSRSPPRYRRRSRSRSVTRNRNGSRSQSPRNRSDKLKSRLGPKVPSPRRRSTSSSPSRSPRRHPKKVTSIAPSRSSSRSRSRSSSPVGRRDEVKKVASMHGSK